MRTHWEDMQHKSWVKRQWVLFLHCFHPVNKGERGLNSRIWVHTHVLCRMSPRCVMWLTIFSTFSGFEIHFFLGGEYYPINMCKWWGIELFGKEVKLYHILKLYHIYKLKNMHEIFLLKNFNYKIMLKLGLFFVLFFESGWVWHWFLPVTGWTEFWKNKCARSSLNLLTFTLCWVGPR